MAVELLPIREEVQVVQVEKPNGVVRVLAVGISYPLFPDTDGPFTPTLSSVEVLRRDSAGLDMASVLSLAKGEHRRLQGENGEYLEAMHLGVIIEDPDRPATRVGVEEVDLDLYPELR